MIRSVNLEVVVDKMPKRIIELIQKKAAEKAKMQEGWERRQQASKCIN